MASSEQQTQVLQQHKAQMQHRRDIMREEKSIIFRHPGYPDESDKNILFTLYAFDDNDGAPGLHYQTALTVCAIVADNAWHGYFTTRQNDQEIRHEASRMLSPNHEYYFHIPGNHPDPYAIAPSFVDWVFPHPALPPVFMSTPLTPFHRAPGAASSFTVAVAQRDGSCRLSFYHDCIESAHLVPREEADWFEVNSMSKYNRNKMLSGEFFLDDAGNGVAFRRDIHFSFDQKNFAIVPKDGKWVVHFFRLTDEYGPKYHNQPIELLRGVSPAFILARLAWTIFPLLEQFLRHRLPRVFRYRVRVDGNNSTETKRLSADELVGRRGRSVNSRKSPSPSKRKRASRSQDVQEESSRTLARIPSSHISRGHKAARTDSGYAEGEGDSSDKDCDNETLYSNPSETYQTLPTDQQSSSSASLRSILLPSANTFDCIYPKSLPYHSCNPIAKQASRHNARLRSIRKKKLRAQRPSDPDLLCCDYNQAELDIARGVPPSDKMGARRICLLCAGAEYWPPEGVDDVLLDFGDGEVEGLGNVRPMIGHVDRSLEAVIEEEAKQKTRTMEWLSEVPDVFERGVEGG